MRTKHIHVHPRKESTLHLLTPARRAALAALAATTALALVHPSPSQAAGTYVHQGCATGADLVDASGGWRSSFYGVAGINTAAQCPWGGLHAEMFPGSAIPAGAAAAWIYDAPANTSISRFSGSFAGWTKPYDGSQGLIQVVNAAGTAGVAYTGSLDPSHQRNFDWGGLATSSVTARILCDGAACSGSTAWASFYYPKIYLDDAQPPVTGSTSGSLTTDRTLNGDEALSYTATDAGGGVARLRLYVDGHLSTVDHVINTNNGHCAISATEDDTWIFSWPKPCPASVSDDETIDTTKIPDGHHTLTAKVVDAGQRESTLWTGEALVANHPPVNTQLPSFRDNSAFANPLVGSAIVALNDGTWTGPNLTVTRAWAQCDGHGSLSSCDEIPGATDLTYTPSAADVGHRLRFMVTATNVADSVTVASSPTGIIAAPSSALPLTPKPAGGGTDGTGTATPPAPALPVATVTPATEHAFRGRVSGEPAGTGCPQDKATLRFEHVSGGKLKLGFGRTSTAQVQLTCTNNGKAIEAAQLDVATRVGSRATVAADVVTDGAGHATLRLAKGASRAISVGYRMYADDPLARATATLKVAVKGRVALKGNRRHLHNGQAVTLRGALRGGEVPKRGVTLAVQWKDGHRWRPFAQIKSTRKGTFSYAYKFTRTGRKVTYALRVQVTKGQVDYPYLPVASKAVKVTVAP
jgi:hypothetical protein